MTATESLTETNREIVKKLYAFGSAGDLKGLATVVADDVVVREPAFLPYGGTYNGLAEFGALVPKIAQVLDLASTTVHYTVADGDVVIAALGMRDLASGEMTDFLEQSTLRDGKVVDIKLFYHNAQTMIGQPKIV